MALKHGINTYKDDTGVVAVQTAAVGIPYFIGAWPCHRGKGYTGKPQLSSGFSEAEELGGYSTEWRNADGSPKWNLCQAMYGYHKLMGMSPAIFYNIFDPAKHKKAVAVEEFTVTDHIVELTADAIINDDLKVTAGSASTALTKGTDYEAYYSGNALCIELLADSSSYSADKLKIGYDVADLSTITAEDVEMAVETVEMCRSVVGIVPDLICAPGWSTDPTVAAVMAAKAPSINGLFRAKAVVDINTKTVNDYSKVLKYKTDNGYVSEDMIVC